MFRRPPGC